MPFTEDQEDALIEKLEPKYITGVDRSKGYKVRLAHIYEGTFNDPRAPLCRYGWSGKAYGYSIFRNNLGTQGVCRLCQKRADKGLGGVRNPWWDGEENDDFFNQKPEADDAELL